MAETSSADQLSTPPPPPRPGARTWPWWLVLAAAAVSVALHQSGGFEVQLPPLRISAHNPRPLAWLAVLVALSALLWRRQSVWRADLPALPDDVRRHATPCVAALAAGVAVVALAWNTWTIGGSDSHCYAAQARAFAAGRLHPVEPLALEAPWPEATRTFAPVGFLPSRRTPGELIPICAPGFPLLLAPIVRLWPNVVFWIAPLSAAALVWAASRLGRAIDDGLGGVGTAALTATAPVVLYQAVQPMNDVPTAAALAAAAAWTWAGPRRPLRAGALVGLALLSRPNLLPVVVPFLIVAHHGGRRSLLSFLAACVPIAGLVPILNFFVYGAPLSTGYGDASVLFAVGHVPANATRYTRWLIDTMSPLIVAGLAAPWLLGRESRERWRMTRDLLLLAAIVLACYLAYVPFEEWWYLRFLLPAIPVLCALMAASVFRLLRPAGEAAGVLCMAIVLALAWRGLTVAGERDVFRLHIFEQRLSAAAAYVQASTPDAVAFAVQPGGAIRHRLERPVVSWDSLDPRWLDRAVAWLAARGTPAVLVIDAGEDSLFRRRFEGASVVGTLDWPPRAIVHRAVRVYDPRDRARFLQGEHVPTAREDRPATGRARRR